MRTVCLLLSIACFGGDPEPETVCLTELWEVYDYDYDYLDDDNTYAELAAWAWTVEMRSELPNGMTGWTYVGFIRFARVIRYDSDEEETDAWWCTQSGRSGSELTTEDAVQRILEHYGHRGEFQIRWR